jgi:hypothetical protein
VAADVAFDALLKSYRPTELIGLQYHLHIPLPDPLTNKDTEARQQYYGGEIRGTPSTFFNGHNDAAGGGPMAAAQGKYQEYRGIIDKQLEAKKGADIKLSATRAGDQIEIAAQATILKKSEPDGSSPPQDKKKEDGDGANDGSGKSSPKLRLVLTEEAVRYVGGNKLRFHHHVVRDFPGGIEGKELSSGQGRLDVKLSLAGLRRDIENYLSNFTKMSPFPTPLPEIALKDLSVVAFVQDDADKSILHAVSVPVKEANP